MEQTIEKLKGEISALKEERDALKVESKKMYRKVERCEYKLSKIKTKELRELRVKLDDVEQKFYEKDVQLVGLPELPENECN